ncbi:MAG: PAAR domain-containing protein [bacterium]
MGYPAARIGDQVMHDRPHCHAPIHPPAPIPTPLAHAPQRFGIVGGCQTVQIGGQFAVRVGDPTAICNLVSCVPGPGGMIGLGSATVMIGGRPAARVGDMVSFPGCVSPIPSPTGTIVGPGCPTVSIGG